jgi:hypothetical protein
VRRTSRSACWRGRQGRPSPAVPRS